VALGAGVGAGVGLIAAVVVGVATVHTFCTQNSATAKSKCTTPASTYERERPTRPIRGTHTSRASSMMVRHSRWRCACSATTGPPHGPHACETHVPNSRIALRSSPLAASDSFARCLIEFFFIIRVRCPPNFPFACNKSRDLASESRAADTIVVTHLDSGSHSGWAKDPDAGYQASPRDAVNFACLHSAVVSNRVPANPCVTGIPAVIIAVCASLFACRSGRILVRAERGCAGSRNAVELGTTRHGQGRSQAGSLRTRRRSKSSSGAGASPFGLQWDAGKLKDREFASFPNMFYVYRTFYFFLEKLTKIFGNAALKY